MKHLWCWLSLGCALICYVQRCRVDARWWQFPVVTLLLFGPILVCGVLLSAGLAAYMDWITEQIARWGWLGEG